METYGYYDITTALDMQMHILNGYGIQRTAKEFRKTEAETADILLLLHQDICVNCLISEDRAAFYVSPDFVIMIQSAYEYLCRKYEDNEAFRFCCRECSSDELFDRLIKHVILMYGEKVFRRIPADWGADSLWESKKRVYR